VNELLQFAVRPGSMRLVEPRFELGQLQPPFDQGVPQYVGHRLAISVGGSQLGARRLGGQP
jgi:hypothetical protein